MIYTRNKMGIRERVELESATRRVEEVGGAANIAFVVMAENGTIDEVTATEHIDVFSPWVSGNVYAVGNLRSYNDVLYKCIQAHTAQDDWTPDKTPALWVVAGDPTVEFPDWSQPIGAQDAYMAGDKVSHHDAHWISTVDNNVWEPGVYGWNVAE